MPNAVRNTVAIALLATAAFPLRAQSILRGRVLRDRDSLPIAHAEVRIASVRIAAITDSAGRFTLGDIPAGAYIVQMRRIGYAPVEVMLRFRGRDTVNATVMLSESATALAPVITLATPDSAVPPRYRDIIERSKRGFGHFFSFDQLEQMRTSHLTEVLTRWPGVHPVRVGGDGGTKQKLASNRGPTGGAFLPGGGGPCIVRAVYDGVPLYDYDLDDIQVEDLMWIEYYDAASAPVQYRDGRSSCGVLLLWSR
jgi:hypothetical protein